METKERFIIQRNDGALINLHYQPVKSLFTAARFNSEEEGYHFLRDSHFKTDEPELYRVIPVEISIHVKEEAECVIKANQSRI
jgi:hypothetical protein